jgi:hypothetical protein
MSRTPFSKLSPICLDGKHANRAFCFGAFEWKYRKGASNVADALSRRDVAGSVWHYCRAARLIVVGTAGVVAAEDQKTYRRISISGQGESVSGDQSSAEMLTFDLSIPLLKRLITGSWSLYRKVQGRCNLGFSMPTECQRPKSRA